MELKDIKMISAISLGAIGTSLGIINLYRDIKRNKEVVEISACPVVRVDIGSEIQSSVEATFSKIEAETSQNRYRNIGLWNMKNVEKSIERSAFPNLIGFEVFNGSNRSIYLDNVGLCSKENMTKYQGKGFDAIQSIKAESRESSPLEVKSHSKFVTYCYIDELLAGLLSEGLVHPFVETQSRKKRISSESESISYFGGWLNKHHAEHKIA